MANSVSEIVTRAVSGDLSHWPLESVGGLLLDHVDISTAVDLLDHIQADRDTIKIFRYVKEDGRDSIFNFPPQPPFTVGAYLPL